MNVALVHDWLNQLGGAEDVLDVLHATFPTAPVYTSIYDRERMPQAWQQWNIRSTWMDRLPRIHKRHQPYMAVFAAVWSRTRVPREYDTLLSNKSAFCIGARGAAGARHLCYCLTPTRFVYDFDVYSARERIPAAARPVLRVLTALLRRWESAAAQRVTTFAAISIEVRKRIRQHYGRDSVVIYPPVDTERFKLSGAPRDDGFYLIVSRLLPYKRIDLAIQVCNNLHLPLVIAGAGRDAGRLAAMAGPTVKLLGRVSDAELFDLLARCRSFIFPGLEDFGIAPIQAMSMGKPVIAFAGGGALDTVVDGRTGILFERQTAESLANGIQRMAEVTFAPDEIRVHAERFSVSRFRDQIFELTG